MIKISEITNEGPKSYQNKTQEMIYNALNELNIPFERVENDYVVTMEDCEELNKTLKVNIVKNLFLCNRQETDFYLLVTRGDKRFKSKYFSKALDIARVSFANEEYLEKYLGTTIGATTIFSVIFDKDNKVKLVIDEEILENEYYACNDGTNNAHIKVKTKDLLEKYLPHTNHEPIIIKLEEDE